MDKNDGWDYEMPRPYSIWFRSYGPHTVCYMEQSQGQIIQKPNKQVLFSLFMTHHLNVMHAPVKFHKYIPYGVGVMKLTVYNMELSQGQIIQKQNKQELSYLFMTHHLNVMHAPVKFHKYIPYGLGVTAHTRFIIWN